MSAPRLRPMAIALILGASLVIARPAAAEPLVADLSDHLIAVTTGFTGADVLLFGATDGPGDIVVTIKGPVDEVSVWRKTRVAGIWVNSDSVTFGDVPGYYAIAANRPLETFLTPTLRQQQQLGLENLQLIEPSNETQADRAVFRASLYRLKQQAGLYPRQLGELSFLGNQLFRTEFHFPADVPVGSYLVEVLLIRDGKLVSAQTTPLVISKIGAGAEIFYFAHANGFAYGLAAVALALLAGWLAYLVFRRI